MEMYNKTGEFVPDSLIAGVNPPLNVTGIELLEGQGVLQRGTLLCDDGNGKMKIVASDTDVALGILTDDADTSVDIMTTMYIAGKFNINAIITNGLEITNTMKLELRKLNIIFEDVK